MDFTSPHSGSAVAALLPPSCQWRSAIPASDALVQQVHDRGNAIYVLEQFLTPAECRAWIQYGEEEKGFEECAQEASRDYAFRKQARISFESTEVAQQIFDRISTRDDSILPKSIDGLRASGCSSNMRLYRYRVGDAFGRHIDESNEVTQDGVTHVSKFTALVYLNGTAGTAPAPPAVAAAASAGGKDRAHEDELPHMQGGETMFYRSHTAARPVYSEAPKAGNLLLHRHGARCLTHEAKAATHGVKYVLRTDVLYSAQHAVDVSTQGQGAASKHAKKMGQKRGRGR